MENSEILIEKRKEKVVNFFKTKSIWVVAILLIAIILGVYIRYLPMTDHGGNPGLWDVTTNTWTLGPDLDPWLFYRYAKEMISPEGLPQIDTLRNVPLGFDNSKELQMVSYMIVLTYKFLNVFSSISIEYAAVIMPVIFFGFTIISFFLFVREIFYKKNEKETHIRANIISLISVFLMIVIPVFLSRTVAGIPEKESIGFFFMFLSFYLFLKAWKSEKIKNSIILGVLAGVSTALMGLSWGGVVYVYVTIAIATFIAFILNKIHKKEAITFTCWLTVATTVFLFLSNRDTLRGIITSLDTGMAFLALFAICVHFLVWKTAISRIKLLSNSKLPKNILSLIIAIILGIVLISIVFGPSFIIEKTQILNQMLFKPVTGRWNTTVAENKQPYFTEWVSSFGPYFSNIPVLFWLFFLGSVVLFKKMLNNLKQKDAWVLTGLYILFFFGLVFSRYAPHPSLLDGENFLSMLIYYGSALLFASALIYYYLRYYREKNTAFETMDYGYILLFSLAILCLFTARSAVRLVMVLGPIMPILFSFLIVCSVDKFRKSKEETAKLFLGVMAIIVIIAGIFIFWNFYSDIKTQAYSFVPSYYNQQWQKAMSWTRDNTSVTAVFAHWWDYGYWVQSIGQRATMVDGGNAITYWNYLIGRHVLTGDNQQDALEVLYNHNVSYFLVDSSDIGKYGAYSIIGSDANFDKFSPGPSTFISDPQQIQETANGTIRIYSGGVYIDEDISYDNNGTKISLFSGKAAIVGIIVEYSKKENSTVFNQPTAVFYNNGQQINIPLRYIYYNGKIVDFGSGLKGTAQVIQEVSQTSRGIQVDDQGALMYISPRIMRGFFGQVYLLNDPFNNFPNFRIVHSEPNLIIDSLNKQGAKLNEFIDFGGSIQGPIKIWSVQYTGNEQIKQEYQDTDATKYLPWEL